MIDLNELEGILIDFIREAQDMTNSDMQGRATVVARDIIERCY